MVFGRENVSHDPAAVVAQVDAEPERDGALVAVAADEADSGPFSQVDGEELAVAREGLEDEGRDPAPGVLGAL